MTSFAEYRQQANLTLSEAEILLNLSGEIVRDYERGARVPTPREIQILKGLALGQNLRVEISSANEPDLIRFPSDSEPMTKPAKRKSSSKFTSLELCAGGGGAALGLEAAGFAPSALVELDRHACATLRRNRPYWNVIEGDVRGFEAERWKGVDLVSGGCPVLHSPSPENSLVQMTSVTFFLRC